MSSTSSKSWNRGSQSSHYPCAASAGSLRLKTDFTATVFNFAKRNELFPPVATHRSILWLVTSGLRRLQDIAKRGRRVFVFLLIEPDIKLWRATTIYCTQPETFAMMSMAHDWRPCTWWVNAQLEAWMLLGRVFGMVYSCLFSGCEHLFVSFSPAVLLCFEAYPACCSTFACRTAGTAACWAAGLRNGQLPVSSLWGQRAFVRLPASETPVPEKSVKVLVFHIIIMFRIQRLDECLKERGTQEVAELSDS